VAKPQPKALLKPYRLALVIEDDPAVARAIVGQLRPFAAHVVVCVDLASARTLLETETPDLVTLDLELPDGRGLQILDRLLVLVPMPFVVVISGHASPGETFLVRDHPVLHFMVKPWDPSDLKRLILGTLDGNSRIRSAAKDFVGDAPLREVIEVVRGAMVTEALRRSKNSKRGAAKILGTHRQAVQGHVKRHGDEA
jgi:DNA-binding NtrC family response regulator